MTVDRNPYHHPEAAAFCLEQPADLSDGTSFREQKLTEKNPLARIHRSPYNKEERLQKALDYLEKNNVLKVSQYMVHTGQAHTTAACELRAFSRDASSGIIKVEREPATVYVKGK